VFQAKNLCVLAVMLFAINCIHSYFGRKVFTDVEEVADSA